MPRLIVSSTGLETTSSTGSCGVADSAKNSPTPGCSKESSGAGGKKSNREEDEDASGAEAENKKAKQSSIQLVVADKDGSVAYDEDLKEEIGRQLNLALIGAINRGKMTTFPVITVSARSHQVRVIVENQRDVSFARSALSKIGYTLIDPDAADEIHWYTLLVDSWLKDTPSKTMARAIKEANKLPGTVIVGTGQRGLQEKGNKRAVLSVGITRAAFARLDKLNYKLICLSSGSVKCCPCSDDDQALLTRAGGTGNGKRKKRIHLQEPRMQRTEPPLRRAGDRGHGRGTVVSSRRAGDNGSNGRNKVAPGKRQPKNTD
jgi:hypothetical protein